MSNQDPLARSTAGGAPGPCDPEALRRIRSWGGDKLVRDLTRIFEEQMPVRVATAREGLRDGLAKPAERAAHALRSSCAQLGAVRMNGVCELIEQAAARGETASLGALLDTLELEFVHYRECLPRVVEEMEGTT